MNHWSVAALGFGIVAIASCSSSDGPAVTCGAGTVLQGNECLPSAGAGNTAGASSSSGNGAGGNSGSRDEEAGSGGTDSEAGMGGELGPGGSGSSAGNGGSAGGNSAGTGSAGTGTAGSAGTAGTAGTAGSGSDQTGLITSALECGSRDVTGATVLSEPITQSTTWSGVIHLPNGLSIRNEPTLTIAPGTKIIVGHNASVEFGYLGSQATIIAAGTIDKPIKFCGEADTAGYWNGAIFRSGIKRESVLRNVLFADGGAKDAALTLEMSLLVQGVQVRHSGSNGVHAAGFDPASSLLVVSGSKNLALRATAAKGVEVPPGSVLTGNGLDVIDVAFASFDTDATFRDSGVPYQQLNDIKAITTVKTPVVSFEPGVSYGIERQKVLDFGTATVHAVGSPAKPVVFQRFACLQGTGSFACSGPAQEGGGRIAASGLDVRFEHVEMRRLGWVTQYTYYRPVVTGALTVSTAGTLKIAHLTLPDATGYGLKFTGAGKFSADSTDLQVRMANAFGALWLGCTQLASLPTNLNLSNAQASDLYTVAECSSIATPGAVWRAAASPYTLDSLTISNGSSLTLEAGAVLRFPGNALLTVQSGGSLQAIGTPTAKVQFKRETYPISSSSGNWGGIIANVGSSVQLDYTLVELAGSYGNAILAYTPIGFSHSTISYSYGVGLRKSAADTTDYLTSNTFTSNLGANVADIP